MDDPSPIIFDLGDVAERGRLEVELFQLFNHLSCLGIWVPKTVDLDNLQQRVDLVQYLTALESFSERGNLPAAKAMDTNGGVHPPCFLNALDAVSCLDCACRALHIVSHWVGAGG